MLIAFCAFATGKPILPTPVALASEVLDTRGCYLLDDGQILICWVGRAASAELLQDLFGTAGISDALTLEPAQDTDLSKRANALVAAVRFTQTYEAMIS